MHHDDDDDSTRKHKNIYQGICSIDYAQHTGFSVVRQRIRRYQAAEVPFVVRNDPAALQTAVRWQPPTYLHWLLQGRVFRTEFTTSPVMLWNRLWTWKKRWAAKEEQGGLSSLRQTFQEPMLIRPLSFAK